VGQVVIDGPTANGGWIDPEVEASMDFRSGQTIRGRRSGGEQSTQQGFDTNRPPWSAIATGATGFPVVRFLPGCGAEVMGVDLIKARTAQAQSARRDGGQEFLASERRQDLTDQR
jgi:hypothetical protein